MEHFNLLLHRNEKSYPFGWLFSFLAPGFPRIIGSGRSSIQIIDFSGYLLCPLEVRFFPAAGVRNYSNGASGSRGHVAYYWTSSVGDINKAWRVKSDNTGFDFNGIEHTYAISVRCVAHES